MSAMSADAVEQLISSDIAACESLLQLLDEEQNALKDRQIEALEPIIEKKTSFLLHLEQSAIKRQQWSQQAKIAADSSAWQDLIEEFKRPGLLEQWRKLKALLDDCRDANEINGKLLARSQEMFERISNILRGQNQKVSLYGASGRTTQSANSSRVGEA